MANKVRVLLLSASPKDLSRISSDDEFRAIRSVLPYERFEIDNRGAVRISDLQATFLDVNPQIVHFSGHGAPDGLVLEDDTGHQQSVPIKHLANLFKEFNSTIQVVCLSACYSESQAIAIYEHINCVVGMKDEFTGAAAAKFASGFYRALGRGEPYSRAFRLAVNEIGLDGIEETKIPQPKIRRDSTVIPLPLASMENPMNSVPSSNRNNSISIGGSVTGSAVTSGDNNTVSVTFQQAALPEPASVNIQAEIDALREVLATLSSPDRKKIDNALEEVEDELKKPEPDKDEVGKALDRAMTYATKANGFAEAIDKLRPHVEKTASWLGENWYKLLPLVNLAV